MSSRPTIYPNNLSNLSNLSTPPIFGIAGNFADHMTQAGENNDFNQIQPADKNAPKGIFPIYLPNTEGFLSTNPISSTQIKADFSNHIQLEAEVCILFEATYRNQQMTQLTPLAYSAFNDCSIRQHTTAKLSTKKNWGPHSAGMSKTWQPITDFSPQGTFKNLHLISFLQRNQTVIQYGADCPVQGYQYFNQKLLDWLIQTFNQQTSQGPLEDLHQTIELSHEPKQIIITLGATRYTKFGETGFLQPNDKIGIFIYDHTRTQATELKKIFATAPPNQPIQHGIALIQNIKATTQLTPAPKNHT